MKLSPRMNIAPSATLRMNTLALEKKRAGHHVYNLSVGEPLIPTPLVIIEAAHAAMAAGKTLYPPVAGIPELRDAASAWLNRVYGTEYAPKQTLVTCGGKHGVNMAIQALIEAGDEVLMIAPYWVSYSSIVELYGGQSVIIKTAESDGWKATPEMIRRAKTSKAKVIILNTGANPTGALYSEGELRAILAVAKENNLFVLSDEVYSGLVYDQKKYISAGSFPDYREDVLVIQSASKNFAMTGWRVGFAFGPTPLIEAMTMLQGQSTTGTSSISQWAAVAAIAGADACMADIQKEMTQRRDVFLAAFTRHFSVSLTAPPSSLYCFIPMSAFGVTETDSTAFCLRVLEEANVALVPGVAFGCEGYVRASFGEREGELSQAVEKLAKYLKK